jgi:exodeoxyribonuclease V alpha subunit
MTVHRLIRPPDGDSLFDHAGILETADLVVIDETSMLDLALARKLFAAVREGCHLVLVGDTDQLPSVGPGRVLRDLLEVDAIPRTRLTKVFRQHDDSAAIVINAHRILRGDLPEDDPRAFWNRPIPGAEDIAQRVGRCGGAHRRTHLRGRVVVVPASGYPTPVAAATRPEGIMETHLTQ